MSENPLNSVQENLDHRGFDETPQQVFERYLHFLQITPKEFEGKSVLDVGAGSAGFAKYVQDAQLSTTVVSVDRNLNENESPVTKAMYVVAKAQDLPFKDGTFDYVVSVFTLLDCSHSYPAAISFTANARCLKPFASGNDALSV